MNRKLKISLIAAGILVLILLVANFALNFWLKNNLPDYLKKKTPYLVSYKKLDVDLVTGNITSEGISINNKNPANTAVIGLQGTVDSLLISRLGIYDALVNKKINSSDLRLIHPNLNVTLAKPVNDKTGKKSNPFLFKNIKIKDGNINIYQYTKQKYLSVQDLQLNVSNLQMTEESVEDKLPVVFDQYEINGKKFFFRPDGIYALTANEITTKNALMSITDFRLNPLLNYNQFRQYFPKKRNMYDFSARRMEFRDIALKDNKISLSKVHFTDPVLKLYTTDVKPQEKEKSFKYDVNLEDAALTNAKVIILKPDQTELFSGNQLNLDVSNIKMDEQSAKGNIPFNYEKFLVSGKELNYRSDVQQISVASLAANNKSVEIHNVAAKPLVSASDKALLDLNLNLFSAKINDWKMVDNKLKMDVESILLDGLSGGVTLSKPNNKTKDKNPITGIAYPFTVKSVSLKNSEFSLNDSGGRKTFKGLQGSIKNLQITEESAKSGFPFQTSAYQLSVAAYNSESAHYVMNTGAINVDKGRFSLLNFSLKPKTSRAQFLRNPVEKELYTINIKNITGNGSWDLASDNKFLKMGNVAIDNLYANIFSSADAKGGPEEKPLYATVLRSIKFPMVIDNLHLANSTIEYEEDAQKGTGAGKLSFTNSDVIVKNLNSGKEKGRPTAIPITIHSRFMGTSPMSVLWTWDPAKMDDAFTISGNVTGLNAEAINRFIEPYMGIQATGSINELSFNFHGNKGGIAGPMKMKHENLKIAIYKPTGEKNKILTAVANMFVKNDSGQFPESVQAEHKREPSKSFFNLFWHGLEDGLKKILISKSIDKQINAVKKTVTTVKETVKGAKEIVAPKDDAPKPAENKTGKFLKKIFGKKQKAEN